MKNVLTTEHYTIRCLDTNDGVSDIARIVVNETVEKFYESFKPNGHLFITLIDCENFTMPGDDEGCCGLYHEGIQHLTIGTAKPDGNSDDKWSYELRMNIAHELIHYMQELEGTLGQDEYEEIAESSALAFVESLGFKDPEPLKENK